MIPHEFKPAIPDYGDILSKVIDMPPEKVDEILYSLALPLIDEPPDEYWARLTPDGNEAEARKVPFVDSEIEAIWRAQKAHSELTEMAGRYSGPAREYWLSSTLFPVNTDALADRPLAVWRIITAALAAQNSLVRFNGTAWQPTNEEEKLFLSIRDLPVHLVAHQA